jgi:hypothetical protein
MVVELTLFPLRCQVLRYLPEKQRYTLELLEPLAGGGGAGKRMDVRPANFVLAHLPAGTRCASWPGGCDGSLRSSPVFFVRVLEPLAAFQYFHWP